MTKVSSSCSPLRRSRRVSQPAWATGATAGRRAVALHRSPDQLDDDVLEGASADGEVGVRTPCWAHQAAIADRTMGSAGAGDAVVARAVPPRRCRRSGRTARRSARSACSGPRKDDALLVARRARRRCRAGPRGHAASPRRGRRGVRRRPSGASSARRWCRSATRPRRGRGTLRRASGVEPRGRLVEEDQLGPPDQRHGALDPLLLAAGQPADASCGCRDRCRGRRAGAPGSSGSG